MTNPVLGLVSSPFSLLLGHHAGPLCRALHPCRFCFGLRPLFESRFLARRGSSKVWVLKLRVLGGERKERTEWHTVLSWKGLGKVARQFVRKGSHILVSGPLHSRQYEKDGVTHTVWEIQARELLLLDPRSTTSESMDSPAPAITT